MTSNIIKSFSDKAYSYDSQSFVQKDVNKRLLSRLDLPTLAGPTIAILKPSLILSPTF